MKLSLALTVLGVVLFAVAFSIPPYKDQRLFTQRYMAMGVGQSEEYWKLRDEMLTPRYQLQDYGVTLIAGGLTALFCLRNRRRPLSAPRKRTTLIAIGIAAALASVAGYVFDLLLAFERGEFPHWADSMGIPLMGVPFLLALLLAWTTVHMLFLRERFQPGAALVIALSRRANLWLLFISAVTVAVCAMAMGLGQYYYAIPAGLWLYFYLSLAAGRRAANGT